MALGNRRPVSRWRKPTPSPQWSDAEILRHRLKQTEAQRDALLAWRTAHLAAHPAYDQAIADAVSPVAHQMGADAAVKILVEDGRLNPEPTNVRRVMRDPATKEIVALYDIKE